MGYVPPPPSGIVTLPPGVTFTPAEMETIKQEWMRPRAYILPPPDYSLIDGWKPDDPRGWTERHVNALGYGLLASVGTLIVYIAWLAG